MSNPVGPFFSNIFIVPFAKNIMPQLTELGLKCWLRYVDDTFVILENKNNKKSIIDLLNAQQLNIRFTSEEEPNSLLLDVKVVKVNGRQPTTIYRKPTFTGLYQR